jgi:hypothetical protein
VPVDEDRRGPGDVHRAADEIDSDKSPSYLAATDRSRRSSRRRRPCVIAGEAEAEGRAPAPFVCQIRPTRMPQQFPGVVSAGLSVTASGTRAGKPCASNRTQAPTDMPLVPPTDGVCAHAGGAANAAHRLQVRRSSFTDFRRASTARETTS